MDDKHGWEKKSNYGENSSLTQEKQHIQATVPMGNESIGANESQNVVIKSTCYYVYSGWSSSFVTIQFLPKYSIIFPSLFPTVWLVSTGIAECLLAYRWMQAERLAGVWSFKWLSDYVIISSPHRDFWDFFSAPIFLPSGVSLYTTFFLSIYLWWSFSLSQKTEMCWWTIQRRLSLCDSLFLQWVAPLCLMDIFKFVLCFRRKNFQQTQEGSLV